MYAIKFLYVNIYDLVLNLTRLFGLVYTTLGKIIVNQNSIIGWKKKIKKKKKY